MILMPMMYKMGVMMTLLMVLTAISVKGLIIGKHRCGMESIARTNL
jgi:hypothetical protein